MCWLRSQGLQLRSENVHLCTGEVRLLKLICTLAESTSQRDFCLLRGSSARPGVPICAWTGIVALQLDMLDWREVERLLCGSFRCTKSICHHHRFLFKRSKVGLAWDVDWLRRRVTASSDRLRIGRVVGIVSRPSWPW